MKVLHFLVFTSLKLVCCAPSEDLITNLPGLSHLPSSYKQYSGYLTASSTKHFHYWFVESQNDPASDPVVLWLNGGPGCSSLDGLLSENGPLHVNNDGETLYENYFSWNKIANVIYLESPAGVGYSYDDNDDIKTDDDKVSMLNYNAVVDFFKKFPEFQKNPFFVTGESYGGTYVPTLSIRILEGGANINFQGLAIGNGLLNTMQNNKSLIFFAYYHGLFGQSLKNSLSKSCCNNAWDRETCDFTKQNGECQNGVAKAFYYVQNTGLNNYALYLDCYGGNGSSSERYRHDMSLLFRNLNHEMRMEILNMKLTSGRKVNEALLCINGTASTNWLNKPDVRAALHIKNDLPQWSVCSTPVRNSYKKIYQNMTAQFNEILKHSNLRVLVYYGDTDMQCNFLGGEWFVDDLKRPIKQERAPWYIEGQVAGFAKTFDRITYTTIRGAGHMVPQWAPKYAYVMFDKFINNKPFTV